MNIHKQVFNDIIAIKKNNEIGLDFATVYENFKKADSVEDIKKIVEQAKDRLFISWSTVDCVDSTGERIPINEAIEQAKIHIERGGSISLEHSNDILGKTIDYKVMVHPETKTIGIMTLNKIYNHNEMDNKAWDKIKMKEIKGSSVGGFRALPEQYETDENGNMIKVLAGFRQNETAITENPANPYATIEGFSAVAKSQGDKMEGNFIVENDIVYKLEKQGNLVKKTETEQETVVSVKNSNEVNNDINQETNKNIIGDLNMEEKINKSSGVDVLKSAMDKFAKSEPLNAEEKELLKKALEDKEEDKEEDKKDDVNEETEKSNGEDISQTGGTIAPNPDPEEENQVDVTKTVNEAVTKALKEQENKFKAEFEKLSKSMTINTPRPVNDMEKIVKNNDFTSVNPVDIAVGKVRKSWSEVQSQDNKLYKELVGDSL